MVQFYHNSWCYSFSHSQAGYRVDIIDHWSIFDHWSIIDLNGWYSWIFGRYCIKMVDISPKYLKMVIDFPYYLKYDKSQDFKVYSAIKWSHMKISTSTLYLLGSRIQSCPNKHAYFCRKMCKYMRAFQGTFVVEIWSIKCCVVDIWSIFRIYFWWSIFNKTPVASLHSFMASSDQSARLYRRLWKIARVKPVFLWFCPSICDFGQW